MKHALGGETDLSKQTLLNDVLAEVTSMHEWDFLAKGEAFIDLRARVAFSGWDWTASGNILLDPTESSPLADYTYYPTDIVKITAGGTAGYYPVASKPDDDSVTLSDSISSTNITANTVEGEIIPRCHPLPSDFRSLIDIGFIDNTQYLGTAPKQTVARLERNTVVRGLANHATVEWADQNTPMLRIEPYPETFAKSALSAVYRRRLAIVGSDGGEINAPEFMHRLIKNVARAIAQGLEMPGTYGTYDDQLAKIMAGPVFINAVNADGGSMSDLGPISEGGHVPRKASFDSTWPPATLSVTGP